MINIKNLTPHAIRVFAADGTTELVTVPPSGTVARASVSYEESGVVPIEGDAEALLSRDPLAGIPVYVSVMGDVEGLPEPEAGTVYIVSTLVRQALPRRTDLLSPGELIRNEAGQPIGCRGLVANS